MNLYSIIKWKPIHGESTQKDLKKKHNYKLEVWRYHKIIHRKEFTNFRKLQHYIKDEGFSLMYDDGDCMIYVYLNNRQLEHYWSNKYYYI